MFIAKVEGNVWATRKNETLVGWRMMIVRPVDPADGKPLGSAMMALDGGVDSGPGDIVLVLDEGGSARMMTGVENMPVRTIICGIVDSVTSNNKELIRG
jgi:ethanolamine utilization protein EutN